ncbi:hypothetical protein OFC04_27140, partial [Escherichia coli]|nr:hypothetical protein [Escherichia coli]
TTVVQLLYIIFCKMASPRKSHPLQAHRTASRHIKKTNHNVTTPEHIRTPITDLYKINHPIFLAGMNVAAGPPPAAAVTNASG